MTGRCGGRDGGREEQKKSPLFVSKSVHTSVRGFLACGQAEWSSEPQHLIRGWHLRGVSPGKAAQALLLRAAIWQQLKELHAAVKVRAPCRLCMHAPKTSYVCSSLQCVTRALNSLSSEIGKEDASYFTVRKANWNDKPFGLQSKYANCLLFHLAAFSKNTQN